MELNLPQLTAQCIDIVHQAGKFIHDEASKFTADKVHVKSLNSLVSYVDVGAEKILVDGLKKLFPEAGFITEENTATEKATYQWVIDPLDGTTNFIHGVPAYCVSVGLIKNGKPILGVVHEIARNETFSAWINGGAYLNSEKICVTKTKALSDCLIATGFPYEQFDFMTRYMKILSSLMSQSRGIRRIGSAALDLAYVACGRFDAFYEFNLNAWDVCGGAIIVQEAGGGITDFNDGDNFLFGKEILASNNLVHGQMLMEINLGKYPVRGCEIGNEGNDVEEENS